MLHTLLIFLFHFVHSNSWNIRSLWKLNELIYTNKDPLNIGNREHYPFTTPYFVMFAIVKPNVSKIIKVHIIGCDHILCPLLERRIYYGLQEIIGESDNETYIFKETTPHLPHSHKENLSHHIDGHIKKNSPIIYLSHFSELGEESSSFLYNETLSFSVSEKIHVNLHINIQLNKEIHSSFSDVHLIYQYVYPGKEDKTQASIREYLHSFIEGNATLLQYKHFKNAFMKIVT